jgi:hypothetical protein
MYYKRKNRYLSAWILVMLGSILLATIGCDSILPEKLQEKEYDTPAIEQRACYWLSLSDSLQDSLGCQVKSRTLKSCLAGADTVWKDSSDNKIIHATFDQLIDSLKTLASDTLLLISYPADQDTVYAELNVNSGQANSMYIYTSFEYYYDGRSATSNINEYVSVKLLQQDTSLVNSSIDLQGETLSGCSEEVADRIIPIIRARYKVQLAEGVYLVRFILSNPQNIASFIKGKRIRDYYFKLVIL